MKYIVDGVEKTRIELNEMMLSKEYDDYCFELIKAEYGSCC